MDSAELIHRMKNEATSRFPPYILDYWIEGETAKEFYNPKQKKSVLEPRVKRAPRRT